MSTARQAHELGFNVAQATDAMTDLNPAAHVATQASIFPRLAESAPAQEILDLLDARPA